MPAWFSAIRSRNGFGFRSNSSNAARVGATPTKLQIGVSIPNAMNDLAFMKRQRSGEFSVEIETDLMVPQVAQFEKVLYDEAQPSDRRSTADLLVDLARQGFLARLVKFDASARQGPVWVADGAMDENVALGPDQCAGPELEAGHARVHDDHCSRAIIHRRLQQNLIAEQ
jgi:hypothetical protein